jgi:hypothetical protein
VDGRVVSSGVVQVPVTVLNLSTRPTVSSVSRQRVAHHMTRHNTPIHNILSTAPQLNISQKALGTLPVDGNVMPKHVGGTVHNK